MSNSHDSGNYFKGEKAMIINFILNNEKVSIDVAPEAKLLDILKTKFNLTGTKEGCLEGECGSCMVLINNQAINSCITAMATVEGKEVTTIEGFSKTKQFKIISEELANAGAVQCGFCTPGIVISAASLLKNNPTPSKKEIKNGISGNICRCTGYVAIIEGITNASKKGSGKW